MIIAGFVYWENIDGIFKWESERVKKTMKPADMKKFVVQDGIVYDEGRLSPEFQFKTKDLDQIGYLDKHHIVGRIPVVLLDSPVLYAYLMFIKHQDQCSCIPGDDSQGDSHEDESGKRIEMVGQESDCRLCEMQIIWKENVGAEISKSP